MLNRLLAALAVANFAVGVDAREKEFPVVFNHAANPQALDDVGSDSDHVHRLTAFGLKRESDDNEVHRGSDRYAESRFTGEIIPPARFLSRVPACLTVRLLGIALTRRMQYVTNRDALGRL